MKTIFITLFAVVTAHFTTAQSYTGYLTGSGVDADVQPDFGICLMGGAGEIDEGMIWFLEKANGGDVLVIRASGSDGYNNYMYNELGVSLNSVETIVFHNASAANDPYVIERINGAEAIWIAGGNQENYVDYWKDTPISEAINNLLNVRAGAVGGLSAGMAIMAQGYFSAQNGGITSEEALENPFDNSVTLGWDDFIHAPFLENAITETHFNDPTRIRYGRIMAFMARLAYNENLATVRGFAANEYCAIAIGSDGLARAFGEYPQYPNERVYFLQSNCEGTQTPEIIEANQPLTWQRNYRAVKVYEVPATESGENYFDLNDWLSGQGGNWQNWYVTEGELHRSDDELAPDCIVGITEKENNLFTLFPNPTAGLMNIQLSELFSGTWQIADVSGRIVLMGNVNASGVYPIDITGLSNGAYNMILSSGQKHNSTPFIIFR